MNQNFSVRNTFYCLYLFKLSVSQLFSLVRRFATTLFADPQSQRHTITAISHHTPTCPRRHGSHCTTPLPSLYPPPSPAQRLCTSPLTSHARHYGTQYDSRWNTRHRVLGFPSIPFPSHPVVVVYFQVLPPGDKFALLFQLFSFPLPLLSSHRAHPW